jgi:hypothetical protein
LAGLIRTLRHQGLEQFVVYGPWWPRTALADEMRRLGVERIALIAADGQPAAYFFMPGTGGTVPPDADCIVTWIDELLSSDEYADTTGKLLCKDADERHVFLMSGSATPFGVGERLMRLSETLPARAPDLPEGISHVWVVSQYGPGDVGLWVRGQGWELVRR